MSEAPDLDKIISQGRAQHIAVSSSQYDQIIQPYLMIIRSLAQRLSETEKPNRAQRRAQAKKDRKNSKESKEGKQTND